MSGGAPEPREGADRARVAVVTGGSRGIGAATSLVLAARGWRVCLSYVRDRTAADETARRCGNGAVAVRADTSSDTDVRALFEAADRMGRLGVVVSNAGIVAPASRVDSLDAARIERMLAVNVLGPFLCAREGVRRMSTARGGDGGTIVNISSLAARMGGPNQYVDYAASKAAVDTLTIGLAREVATEGIRVNSVRPGLIDTAIHASGGQPDRVERLSPMVPMGRAGTPGEVAEMVSWLCSEAASYVTGAIFEVGGGL